MKIIFTDLDGTLLDNDWSLSEKNRETLNSLGKQGIIRVVATGRNLYSAQKVLSNDFPIDYLIFSTGSGIMDWQSKEIIYVRNIPHNYVNDCSSVLLREEINFMLHREIPDSHFFSYYRGSYIPPDFLWRIELYEGFAEPYDHNLHSGLAATQFLCMLSPEKFSSSRELLEELENDLSIIKTTSPLLQSSLWLEVYAAGVSKGSAADFLAAKLGVSPGNSMAVGNDYNDLDLLEWSSNGFVVENAPHTMKERFTTIRSNTQNGFSEAVRLWLN